MLSMLNIVEYDQSSPIKRWLRNAMRPSVSAYMRPVERTHYLQINCEMRKGKIDWKMVRAYSLDCSERVLMPTGVMPPADACVRRFTPYAFRRRMLENFAADMLVCSTKRPELRRIAVYGQENEVSTLLPRLVSLAGEVRVITRRAHAVADTVRELTEKYGAAISVTDEFCAAGFDILLAPAGGAAVFRIDGDTIVLSPDRPSAPSMLWIKEARPPLPSILESEYDGRFDITEFVGAFYEAGEIRQLGKLSPACGLSESGEITPEEAALLIGR